MLVGSWAAPALASSSSGEAEMRSAFTKARGSVEGAPASNPLPKAGESSRASMAAPIAGEGLGRALELTRVRSTVRHDLFEEAIGVLSRLGGELVDVDARLEAEGLRLAREWHQLKVAINLGHLQHEHARADAAISLAASREACARAQEEARAADCRCEAAEERERELRASNAALERQVHPGGTAERGPLR